MEPEELTEIIFKGEDSNYEFKSNIRHVSYLVPEVIAFSNSQGGVILIGVNDDGEIEGLSSDDIKRLNLLLPNLASENIRPPITLNTQNVSLAEGLVMIVSVPEGANKPYMDNNTSIYVRNGARSQKLRSREEIQRIFQSSGLIQADATPVSSSSLADLDLQYFETFFEEKFGASTKDQEISLPQLLENMKLAKNGVLNYGGILLFGSNPQSWLPVFDVKALAFQGDSIEDVNYLDSRDIKGRLSDIFQKTLGFLLDNIRHVQNDQGFNSLGEPEISRIVFEELIANALIHRDYFVSAPVKVLVFSNRIEIISPGHLPNNLTTDNIKMGISNVRNPILHSFATELLPYRGLGSGVLRAIRAYPKIEFLDDRDGNTFRVTILRESSL